MACELLDQNKPNRTMDGLAIFKKRDINPNCAMTTGAWLAVMHGNPKYQQ
jgi:hypothetical protein